MSYKFDNDGVLRHGYTIEPYGNVTIASPYTTPFFTPCKYLMLALLVGNAVLIKSSDQCLLTTNLLVK
jgi:acyl-CoA reductase-like NAD-dependent aldehyde dehydrogenase